MYSSSFKRAAAGVALATTCTVGASVGAVVTSSTPAHAAPAHPHHQQRLDTHLSIVAPDIADTEGRATVAGRLTARGIGLDERKVRLLVKREDDKRWTLGRLKTTGKRGWVRFTVLPPAETTYKLAFFGTRSFQKARSEAATVAARDTAVSITATPGSVAPGATSTISGVVTDEDVVVAGATVELRARKAGTSRAFEPVATAVSGADGSVGFTVTPRRSTAYVLVARKTETSQKARSEVATVAVAAPTRTAARGRALGQTYSVVGILSSRGKGLPGRVVRLEAQAAGATDWTRAKAKRTARDGYVDFRVTKVEGTSYRLVYAGTQHLQPSTSRTVG